MNPLLKSCSRNEIGLFRGGKKGDTNHITGDNIAFIYSDMRTAFLGRFEDKVMVDAREEEEEKSFMFCVCRYDVSKIFCLSHFNPNRKSI